jgi:hypothetical protein
MEPDAPLLEPPVKLKFSVAVEQLRNASVALPTATVLGVAAVESKAPPVVWYSVKAIVRMPGEKLPWPVYQRCPASPALEPAGAYVYHPRNNVAEPGLTSTLKPWPDVAGSNQLPPSAESLLLGRSSVVEQVPF